MEKPIQQKKPKIPNQRLKQAREQRFWTLEDVANHISDLPDFGPGEPDPYTVGRWERGVSFPSPRYCRALCTVFAMDAQALGLMPQHTAKASSSNDPATEQGDASHLTEPPSLHTPVPHSPASVESPSSKEPAANLVGSPPLRGPADPSKGGETTITDVSLQSKKEPVSSSQEHDQPLEQHSESSLPEVPASSWRPADTSATREEWINPRGATMKRAPLELEHNSILLNTASEAPAHSTRAYTPDRKNQQRLLQRVRSFWIHDVLEAAPHRRTLLPLRLQLEPTAVANPWQPLLQEAKRAPQLLPAGISIVEVYDQADGALLILGEAGAGKTTLLLELTRTLLERAEQEEGQPIPVVFNLASWSVKRLTLDAWLVEELHDKYQVPRSLGHSWITNEQLSLLLDGLDEVPQPYQSACLTAINTYRQDHGLISIVVCSRRNAYDLALTPLHLQKAVSLQPLDHEQIEAYLASSGKQSTAMRVALRTDPALHTLLTTPLWLNILMQVCKEQSLDDLLREGSILTRQRQIFTTYLQRMLERRSLPRHATSQQMQSWLFSLARQMQQQNQSIFYLEQLQPTLLATPNERHLYERLALRLPIILIGVLVGLILNAFLLPYQDSVDVIWFGLIGTIIACILTTHQRALSPLPAQSHRFWRSRVYALTCALLFSLISWLSNALRLGPDYPLHSWFSDTPWSLFDPGFSSFLLILLFSNLPARPDSPSPTFWHLNIPTISKALFIGLVLALGSLFPWGWPTPLYGISVGWYYLFCFTAITLVLSTLLEALPATITPAERISWSWQRLWARLLSGQHIRQAILLGGFSGLSTGLSNVLLSPTFSLRALSLFRFGASVGLGLSLSYWLLLGLLRALRSESLHDEYRSKPNEGIHRSARNGLVIGLLGGSLSFVLSLLEDLQAYILSGAPDKIATLLDHMLGRALIIGLAVALLSALSNGWLACWQHAILRWQLWRRSVLPWHATRFLDDAVERLLLYKIGGGYLFIHRLLQEHLAEEDASRETSQQDVAIPIKQQEHSSAYRPRGGSF